MHYVFRKIHLPNGKIITAPIYSSELKIGFIFNARIFEANPIEDQFIITEITEDKAEVWFEYV